MVCLNLPRPQIDLVALEVAITGMPSSLWHREINYGTDAGQSRAEVGMKIIVRQISGLGNQMFQYAAGRYYARRYNAQVLMAIDPPQDAVSHGHPRPFLLSHFSINMPYRELSAVDRLLLLTKHPRLQSISEVSTAILQQGLHLQIVTERIEQRHLFQSELPISAKTQTVYLLGYWQVHNIADEISDDLRREFCFREAPSGKNAQMLRLIRDTANPVSLHLRRGDYTLVAEGNVALPMAYYTRAIRSFKESLSNPTFFVFSDDIDFSRRNLGKDISAVFVDHNDSSSAQEDLRLMSSCRHHIIANSSFSWWGAWLNPDPDKIVIAPRKWMVGNCPRYDDLLPPSWRLLDVII